MKVHTWFNDDGKGKLTSVARIDPETNATHTIYFDDDTSAIQYCEEMLANASDGTSIDVDSDANSRATGGRIGEDLDLRDDSNDVSLLSSCDGPQAAATDNAALFETIKLLQEENEHLKQQLESSEHARKEALESYKCTKEGEVERLQQMWVELAKVNDELLLHAKTHGAANVKAAEVPDGESTEAPDGKAAETLDSEATEMPDSKATGMPDSEATELPDGEATEMPDGDRKNNSEANGSNDSDDSDATERGEMSPALLSCASSHDDPQDSDATVAETNMQQEAQSNSVDSNANNSSSADADSASDRPPTQPEAQPVATKGSTKRKRGGVKAKKEQEKTPSVELRRSARVS